MGHRIQIGNPDPDSGHAKMKLVPQKRKKMKKVLFGWRLLLDPCPDSAECLDPDSVNPDT